MITIFTGDIRSGKTTALQKWVAGRNDIGGFLTPDKNGVRVLFNINKIEYIPFEITNNSEEKSVNIGKFRFYKSSFDQAIEFTLAQIKDPKITTIIIDEVGKLEMKDLGFSKLVEILVQHSDSIDLIFVIRESILGEVVMKYGLEDAAFFSVK